MTLAGNFSPYQLQLSIPTLRDSKPQPEHGESLKNDDKTILPIEESVKLPLVEKRRIQSIGDNA